VVEELGFTSARQGLDPSASGYCTVFRTPGVTKTLQFELEALSVYRPQFPPGSPNEDQNPSNYAHQVINDGRRRWHVVSRTGYAGADYTGRDNHFSHHVLFGPDERPANGPAWTASRKGFLDREWNGQTAVLPGARSLPYDDGKGQPGVCRIWEETVGDAGWAGRLVEAYLESPGLPCYLIYRAGQAILPLIVEALALLPAEQRWNVTFCTYYTAGGKNDCLWRGVLEGTPEAEQALRSSDRSRVFDLRSRQLGPAPASEWTNYARTGQPPERMPPSPDNGGYPSRGNCGDRTNTVVVPKRRSAVPAEESAVSVAEIERATVVPPISAPLLPPPPPPSAKSIAVPLLVAAVVALPITMFVAGGVGWRLGKAHENRAVQALRDKLQHAEKQARQVDEGKRSTDEKLREALENQQKYKEEAKAEGEKARKLATALEDQQRQTKSLQTKLDTEQKKQSTLPAAQAQTIP
jgi:F0F1-type ATP synthase membrane subunit b/b'